MKSDNFNHRFPAEVWHDAKAQARRAMIDAARLRSVIWYSDLVHKIRACSLHHRDRRLFEMLGEVSIDEDKAGRGLLTAVVVRMEDGRPGPGFFKLAESLGRDVSDKERCWKEELKKVHDAWPPVEEQPDPRWSRDPEDSWSRDS